METLTTTVSMPRVVVIGGGTGASTLLSALAEQPLALTTIANVSDDGGSSGRLSRELGVMPMGDALQHALALARNHDLADELRYRHAYGPLAGHREGNVRLAAYEQHLGSFTAAVSQLCDELDAVGRVLPASDTPHTLVLTAPTLPQPIRGEYRVAHSDIGNTPAAQLTLDPPVATTQMVREAIADADLLLFAPGHRLGSCLPIHCVDKVNDAIAQSSAVKALVANILSSPGHTDDWHVADHALQLERYGVGKLDYLIYNRDLPSSEQLAQRSPTEGTPLRIDAEGFYKIPHIRALGRSVLAQTTTTAIAGDPLPRTKFRHDAAAVAREVMQLCTN